MNKVIKMIACIMGLLCSLPFYAAIISSNSGIIQNSEIHYNVSLESVGNRLKIRFTITNKSKEAFHLNISSLSIPGNAVLFFSTDWAPLDSNIGDWCSDLITSGSSGGFGVVAIEPGKAAEVWIEAGDFYDKIYKKNNTDNIYIYWGVTLELISYRPKKTQTPLSRIGGMLTLPKGTRLN
jgi:hypothetical protein